MAVVCRSLLRDLVRRMLLALMRKVLFLEDIGTKPYQWDRMLLHLRYAGLLKKVTGHRLWRYAPMRGLDETELLDRAIFTRFENSKAQLRSVCVAVTSPPPMSRCLWELRLPLDLS